MSENRPLGPARVCSRGGRASDQSLGLLSRILDEQQEPTAFLGISDTPVGVQQRLALLIEVGAIRGAVSSRIGCVGSVKDVG